MPRSPIGTKQNAAAISYDWRTGSQTVAPIQTAAVTPAIAT